jgi:hypothetical protein
MFGRPTEPTTPPPVPATPLPDRDVTDTRRGRDFEYSDFSGNRANFPLAGPPGRLQDLVADVWTAWWRPWALLGIVIVALAIVLIVT